LSFAKIQIVLSASHSQETAKKLYLQEVVAVAEGAASEELEEP